MNEPLPQWQCLYGPVRGLVNRVNEALFDDDLNAAMREVSPMHVRAQLIVNAQALLAEDVARATAIRAVVAAQWATAVALVADGMATRGEDDDETLAAYLARADEKYHANIRENFFRGCAVRAHLRDAWDLLPTATAEQIVDGAA